MKYILIVFTMLPYLIFGQWQWATQIGGTNNNKASIYCIDNNNNYYVAGQFSGYVYLSNVTLVSLGLDDGLIVKFDSIGNSLWAKRIGGNNSTFNGEILSINLDKTGTSLIAVGTFFGTLNIDSFSVTSSGMSDIFIAQFDLNGICIWLNKAGGKGEDIAGAFTCDANNNIFVTGEASDSSSFDAYTIPPGNFFCAYNQNGVCLFSQVKYSSLDIYSIKEINGYMLLSGTTSNTIISIDTITQNLIAPINAFIAKIDTMGNIYWLKTFGSYSNTYSFAFDVNSQSEIYLTGFFEDSTSFGNTTIYHSPPTYSDIYLAKLDAYGNPVWVTQTNCSFSSYATGISCDNLDNVYITGHFGGSAQFGQFNITANGNADFFLAKFNSNSDCVGIRHFGTASSGMCQVDNSNKPIVGGQFINSINIGNYALTSTINNNPDLFFAKADEILSNENEEKTPNNQLLIYANPNQGTCNITVPDDFLEEKNLVLSIYDNIGKLVQQKTLEMNDDKIKLNLEAEAKGVYNVSLSNGKKSYSGKIVFQ